jgi:hypothetical protein
MFDAQARAKFETEGYCRLPGAVPRDALERLRDFIDGLLEPDTVPHKAISRAGAGAVVTNIDDLFAWGDPRPLELLALPGIMEPASAVCGDDLFAVQEFAVIKHRGDPTPVLWHQDMVNRRSAPSLSVGVYLDDADAGDGALRFVPGSHLSDAPIAELARMPAVEVPAKAGDVIVHDMMIAHSSELMTTNALRRVIYLVFLSTELALGETIYPLEVVEARRRLLFAARRYLVFLSTELALGETIYPLEVVEARRRLLCAARRYRRAIAPGGACWKPRKRDPAPRDRKRPFHEVVAEVYAAPRRLPPSNYHLERVPANLG